MPKLKNGILAFYEEAIDTFRRCPASTKFHHNWSGGLYDHTIEVIDYGEMIFDGVVGSALDFTRDDVIFVCFAHDVDKLDKYVNNPDFKKQGRYTADQEFIWNKKKIAINAIAETVRTLSKYGIEITDMQLNALTFAHGGWSTDKGNMESLATILHCADLLSLAFGSKNKTEGYHYKEFKENENEQTGGNGEAK